VEQRRLLLAFVISLFVIIAYERLVLSRYSKPPGTPARQTAPQEAPAASQTPPPPPSKLAAERGEGDAVSVDTDVFHITITPAGGRLSDVRLKAYRRSVAPDSEPLNLVQEGPILPGTLQLGEDSSDAGIPYRPDRSTLDVHGSDEGEVVFAGDMPDGAHVEKRYRFRGDGYAFHVVATLRDRVTPSVGLVLTPLPPEGTSASAELGVALANRKLASHPFKDIAKAPVNVDAAAWAGFAEQYFLVAGMPEAGTASALFSIAEGMPIARVDAPVSQQTASFVIYMGPKDPDILAQAGHDLERAVDFGMFFFVAIPLLKLLRLIHRFTGNYGVAIIVLTAIAKVITAPLTQTTFRNMREMQKIQPQMAKLRERFKDDQVALQKEMMELYKRHRVNPFSGCLPMLLQFPIFIGLYNALSHAIELRHAPFAFWIRDLSAPDWLMIGGIGIPVLTLLMGASMFLQQWLTPAQGDPMQQRMMMFTPLIFTFMFINFPAGLVLYWLVNNVLTIGQQYYMMRSAT